MIVGGIDRLEDEAGWAERTSEFIVEYFRRSNENGAEEEEEEEEEQHYGGGGAVVLDVVTVEIGVTGQTDAAASNGDGESDIFERRRRRLRRRQRSRKNVAEEEEEEEESGGGIGGVEIAYEQRSSYATTADHLHHPDAYDGVYVATRPFRTAEGVEAYLAALRDLSSHYDGASMSVDSVREATAGDDDDPPRSGGWQPVEGKEAEEKEEGEGGENNDGDGGGGANVPAIAGALCGAALLLVAWTAVIVARRRGWGPCGGGKGYVESVGNGPPSPSSSNAATGGRRVYKNLEDGRPAAVGGRMMVSPAGAGRGGMGSPIGDGDNNNGAAPDPLDDELVPFASVPRSSSASEVLAHIVAPPGRLGVVVDRRPEGGPVYVCAIKGESPIFGRIRLEDKIVAVDDIDVQRMTAVDVSRMLGTRSGNVTRKITVLREAD